MSKDYYKILGVDRGASEDEIKKAFRKKAHEHHPDKTGGDDAKFKEANEAYQVLSNKQKRTQYDQFGSDFEKMNQGGFGGGQGFGGFGQQAGGVHFDFGEMGDLGDLFGGMFGGGGRGRSRRGDDIQVDLRVDFKESIFGAEKTVSLYRTQNCDVCHGNGAEPGTKLNKCSECGGEGRVRRIQQTMLGAMQTTIACQRCGGRGEIPEKRCHNCDGTGIHKGRREFTLKVPAGIRDGEALRVSGEGEAVRGGAPGDLFVTVRVMADKRFTRVGNDIVNDLEVTFAEAALGTKKNVATVDGDVELKIPAGTQPNSVLRLKGKGSHALRSSSRGDHLVTIKVVVPRSLSRKQKKMLEEWEE